MSVEWVSTGEDYCIECGIVISKDSIVIDGKCSVCISKEEI